MAGRGYYPGVKLRQTGGVHAAHKPCREVIEIGRQPKIGLDFWLRDVRLFQDPKLRRPRQQFGYLAPYVYECLLDILYGDKGYYIDYRGEAREDVIWQLTELAQGRYTVTVETMASVIDSLVACGLFSGDLFKRGFITSKRAQKGYFSATLGRSAVQINFDIWLLSEEEMRELNPSGKSSVLQSFISWREKQISRQEKAVSQPESTQSRVEEIREEKSRAEKSIVDESREQQSRGRADLLAREIEWTLGIKIESNFRLELARMLYVGMQEDVVLSAMRQTAARKTHNPAGYLRTILQDYEREGIWTASDLDATRSGQDTPTASRDDPTRPLEQWEQDWLKDIERRKRRDKEVSS